MPSRVRSFPSAFFVDLADAEVDEFHDLAVGFGDDDDVRRLEIAMDDAARMRLAQAARHLPEEQEHFLPGERAEIAEPIGERLAVQVLHRDEVDLLVAGRVLDPAVVEERDDVRMLQLREDARLEREALHELRVFFVDRVGLDDLQRDGPIERRLNRVVDPPHAAARDRALDPELAVDEQADHRIDPALPLVRRHHEPDPRSYQRRVKKVARHA